MGIIDALTKRLARKAKVTHKKQIAAHTYQLTIQGDSLSDLTYTPGDFLRILVGFEQSVSLGDKLRTYSIWNYNAGEQSIDLAVCLFSNGPGASWVKDLKVGDELYFIKQKSRFIVEPETDFALMIGDISALAHLYELRRHMAAHTKGIGLIYGESEADFFADLDGSKPFSFYMLPENPIEPLIKLIEDNLKGLQGRGAVYVGGDGRICAALYKYIKGNLGWNSREIKVKPFWMPGKKGLE